MALISSLVSGVSGLKSYSKGIEVIGNNIANVNTAGFKGQRPEYSDSFYNTLRRSGGSQGSGSNTTSTQVGNGVQIMGVTSKFTQGPIEATGIPSDLALEGDGFMMVRDSINDKDFATRQGNLRIDDQGYVVTQNGFRLQGLNNGSIAYNVTESGGEMVFTASKTAPTAVGDLQVSMPLSVGSGLTNGTGGAFSDAQIEAVAPRLDAYEFDQHGNLQISMSNGDVFTLGQVLLQDFNDPQALVREGNGLYTGFDAAGPKSGSLVLTAADNTPGSNGLAKVRASALELSNVDITEQFASVISTQRSFQASARIVTTSDEMLQEIVNLKR